MTFIVKYHVMFCPKSLYDKKHRQLESLTFLDHIQSYKYNKENKLTKVINNQEETIEFK